MQIQIKATYNTKLNDVNTDITISGSCHGLDMITAQKVHNLFTQFQKSLTEVCIAHDKQRETVNDFEVSNESQVDFLKRSLELRP